MSNTMFGEIDKKQMIAVNLLCINGAETHEYDKNVTAQVLNVQ